MSLEVLLQKHGLDSCATVFKEQGFNGPNYFEDIRTFIQEHKEDFVNLFPKCGHRIRLIKLFTESIPPTSKQPKRRRPSTPPPTDVTEGDMDAHNDNDAHSIISCASSSSYPSVDSTPVSKYSKNLALLHAYRQPVATIPNTYNTFRQVMPPVCTTTQPITLRTETEGGGAFRRFTKHTCVPNVESITSTPSTCATTTTTAEMPPVKRRKLGTNSDGIHTPTQSLSPPPPPYLQLIELLEEESTQTNSTFCPVYYQTTTSNSSSREKGTNDQQEGLDWTSYLFQQQQPQSQGDCVIQQHAVSSCTSPNKASPNMPIPTQQPHQPQWYHQAPQQPQHCQQQHAHKCERVDNTQTNKFPTTTTTTSHPLPQPNNNNPNSKTGRGWLGYLKAIIGLF